MNGRYVLLREQVRKSIILMRRYYFDTVSNLLTVYLFFLVIFLGGRTVAPETIESRIEALVVGYFLWTMAVSAYSSTASSITREARSGTLEQTFMSPFGFTQVLLSQFVSRLLLTFFTGSIILLLTVLTTGVTLQYRVLTVVVLAVLSLLPVVGIGLVLGGLALLYKRVGSAFSLVRFALLAFLALPVDRSPVIRLLPLALGNDLIRQSATNGVTLLSFSPSILGILLGKSIVYFGIGYLVYVRLQRAAQRRGVLGHY